MKKRTVKAVFVSFLLLLIAFIVSFFVDFKAFSYVVYGLFGVIRQKAKLS